MTDVTVLVLTDDELTCIAGASQAAWRLPLGGDRDAAAVRASALAGERSLLARGLIAPQDGKYAVSPDAVGYVHPGLTAEPEMIVFVCDHQFRWVLQGMSMAWYRDQESDVLELRDAVGLHHFTMPPRADLTSAVGGYLTSAFESGFPDVPRGKELALCAVVPGAERAYRIAEAAVSVAVTTGEQLASLSWKESSMAETLEDIASLSS